MNVLSLNLDKLKNTFQNILLLRNDVTKAKEQINLKIEHLKLSYQELSKHTTKKSLLFSLDSFFFQYKLFSLELENMNKTRILLNNRMYCDYYKLYMLITMYIQDNADDLSAEEQEFRTYPVYKDLEPFQEYNLEDVKNMHSDIMKFINYLYECYEKNHENIVNYNKKTRIGFSISNMLNTLEHENSVLNQQMTLYVNYLSFFHISQTKHLKNLLDRLNNFDADIEENVNGDHAYSVDDVEDAEPLRKFDIAEVDNQIHSETIIQQRDNIPDIDQTSNVEDVSKTFVKSEDKPTTEKKTKPEDKPIIEKKTKPEDKPTTEKKTKPEDKPTTEQKTKPEDKPTTEQKTKVENKPATEKKTKPEDKPTTEQKTKPDNKNNSDNKSKQK